MLSRLTRSFPFSAKFTNSNPSESATFLSVGVVIPRYFAALGMVTYEMPSTIFIAIGNL